MPNLINKQSPMFLDALARVRVMDAETLLTNLQAAQLNAASQGHKFKEKAENVDEGFCWEDSPQGHDFWSDIHNKRA
jgi:hypothetical protein